MVTTYFLNLAAGNLFGTKTDPAIPSDYYLGLSSTLPQKDGTGVTEPSTSGTAYARVQLTTLSDPVNGTVTNEDVISFPKSTDTWGTLPYFVVFDSASGGNLCLYDELEASRTVESNTVVAFEVGGLSLTVTDLIQTE